MPVRPFAFALAISALALAGCKAPPPEAPTALDDLSLYLFQNFDDEDPLVMQAGVVNLLAFLEDYEADVDLAITADDVARSWSLSALTEEFWGGAPHWAGHDPEDQLPVALAARSEHSGDAHAELVGLVDQTPLESSSSASYDRTFVTDFDCWLSRDCDSLETTNLIHRDNLLLDLVYTAYKDYRWVELPEDGGWAAVGRSWTDQQYINSDGVDTLDFFSNFEITVPSGDGTLRYNILWGAVVFDPPVMETLLVNTVRAGMQDGYENTEAYIADN